MLGPSHPDVATSLQHLALLYCCEGAYEYAKPLYLRALRIREATLGPDHLDVATTLHHLALVYFEEGVHGRAEALYRRALRIRETLLGPEHPDVGRVLQHLTALYEAQGAHKQAELLHHRALQIREASFDPEDSVTATSLNKLAILYLDQGSYGRARSLYQRALQIREATLGPDHPDVAQSLGNLALLYATQGVYERAEPLYQRALQIREAALGPNHPDVAWTLDALAHVYYRQGAYWRAESLYQRALRIREVVLGPSHPDIATSLHHLADLHAAQGTYKPAEPLYQRALQIYESILGPSHPKVALALHSLADLYFARGAYEQAGRLYRRALWICETSLAPSHPLIASTIIDMARVELAEQHLPAAVFFLERSLALSEARLRKEALTLAKSHLTNLLERRREDDERLYALVCEPARAPGEVAALQRLALAAALVGKGRSATALSERWQALHESLSSSDKALFEHLRVLRTRLAQQSLSGADPGQLLLADDRTHPRELEAEGDALEAELAECAASLRAFRELPEPQDIVERVAQALPNDAAFIELVTYHRLPDAHMPGSRPKLGVVGSQPQPAPHYLAFLLLPSGDIHTADLGPIATIDLAMTRLREAQASGAPPYHDAARELHRLVLAPLLRFLGRQLRLFMAPERQLGYIQPDAPHDGQRVVTETLVLTRVVTIQDLLGQGRTT